MMQKGGFNGVVTPVLTPFSDDGSIAQDLYFSHCREMLASGSHYLSPFGTTGEALSVSVAERCDLLEKIVADGVAAPNQLMPGTGMCSLDDTLLVTRHALDLGCAAVMTLPPFFYPSPGDDGLFNYFAALVEATAPSNPKICLYHIPQNTQVGFSPALTARLNEAFPESVVAYKDSSGSWENTEAVMAAAPGISVFPASESSLVKAIPLGAAGCISATCNVNVKQIRRVYDALCAQDEASIAPELDALDQIRNTIAQAGLIPTLKSLRAAQAGDARWLNMRPPLGNADKKADASIGKKLLAELPL